MRVLMAISLVLAAVTGACSVANPNHCANLDGHATCAARDVAAPYCNRCLADNNGCVAEPVADDACDAGSTSLPGTSTTDPTTSTTSSTGNTTASDTSTSTPSTSTSTGPEPTSTTTTTTETSTGSATTTGTDTDTSTTVDTTTDTDTSTTVDTTTDTTEATTMATTEATTTMGPMCGDDIAEGQETCDGADLNGQTCAMKNPMKYGGGILACDPSCFAYDESDCCLTNGVACGSQPCCPGLTCKLLGGNLFGCG
jgi:hypothetical protein